MTVCVQVAPVASYRPEVTWPRSPRVLALVSHAQRVIREVYEMHYADTLYQFPNAIASVSVIMFRTRALIQFRLLTMIDSNMFNRSFSVSHLLHCSLAKVKSVQLPAIEKTIYSFRNKRFSKRLRNVAEVIVSSVLSLRDTSRYFPARNTFVIPQLLLFTAFS